MLCTSVYLNLKLLSQYTWECAYVHLRILAYREHRGGKKTPCKKLQEDDHHSMVNTGLTDSLRLDGDRERDIHIQTEKWVAEKHQTL